MSDSSINNQASGKGNWPSVCAPLSEPVVRSFRVGKLSREHLDFITSMDMSVDGDRMVTSGMDDQMCLHNCNTGELLATVQSRRYGVGVARFTHTAHTLLHTSTKLNDSIRYFSVGDNKYLRFFEGHTQRITSLAMSPLNDTFISSGMDNTMRLWDLRTPLCEGLLEGLRRPVITFDPSGCCIAVGANSETVRLYDVRAFGHGPFRTFKFCVDKFCDWTTLKFSRNGQYMLVCTNGPLMRLLDAHHGVPLQTFTYVNNKGIALEADFSPDSEFVFGGTTDGLVHVWNCDSGYRVHTHDVVHPAPIRCLRFNPKRLMFASACINVAFWLPTVEQPRPQPLQSGPTLVDDSRNAGATVL